MSGLFVIGLLASGALVLLPLLLAPAMAGRADDAIAEARARAPYDHEREGVFGAGHATVRHSGRPSPLGRPSGVPPIPAPERFPRGGVPGVEHAGGRRHG